MGAQDRSLRAKIGMWVTRQAEDRKAATAHLFHTSADGRLVPGDLVSADLKPADLEGGAAKIVDKILSFAVEYAEGLAAGLQRYVVVAKDADGESVGRYPFTCASAAVDADAQAAGSEVVLSEPATAQGLLQQNQRHLEAVLRCMGPIMGSAFGHLSATLSQSRAMQDELLQENAQLRRRVGGMLEAREQLLNQQADRDARKVEADARAKKLGELADGAMVIGGALAQRFLTGKRDEDKREGRDLTPGQQSATVQPLIFLATRFVDTLTSDQLDRLIGEDDAAVQAGALDAAQAGKLLAIVRVRQQQRVPTIAQVFGFVRSIRPDQIGFLQTVLKQSQILAAMELVSAVQDAEVKARAEAADAAARAREGEPKKEGA